MHTRSAVKGVQGLFAVTLCMGVPLAHAADTYVVKGTSGAGGTLNATSQTIVSGKKAVFLVEAKAGYKVDTIAGCGGKLSGTTYTTAAITKACTVSATFKSTAPTGFTVTLKTTGTGTGTVVVIGVDKDIPAGTTVKLAATPDEGSTFVGWEPLPCAHSFVMPANKLTCTATFTKVPTMPVPKTVRITAGCFQMGSPEDEVDRGWYGDETAHEVCINDDFEIGQYEVTFDEYTAFCEAVGRFTCALPNDNDWGSGKRPVINVRWEDAVAYTKWLSKETGMAYRLPTEAEWEYAARAGTKTVYWTGNSVTPEQANFGHWLEQTTEVGAYAPNPWNLYDTIGNVWEWTCSNWSDPYDGAESTCGTGGAHTIRGGSWAEAEGGVRSAIRAGGESGYGDIIIGFRVAKSL